MKVEYYPVVGSISPGCIIQCIFDNNLFKYKSNNIDDSIPFRTLDDSGGWH